MAITGEDIQGTFDYVIVGGGSAGCVLARRLAEATAPGGGKFRVALLEAGPVDDSLLVRMPFGVVGLVRGWMRNWMFNTRPDPGVDNRRLYWPRGKTLGGSSAINAMVCTRGHRADYDGWAALGNPGWDYAAVLPFFKKSETYEPGADEFHGAEGPLNIHRRTRAEVNPLCQAFVAAGVQAGHPENPDFNGRQQEGVGFFAAFQKNGRRCSNAHGYLGDFAKRFPNLLVIGHARATKLLLDDGKRVSGVRYRLADGSEENLAATREVLVSAGAVMSPHLLLLSGIGPAAELSRHGVRARHELPGVGANLQDHLDVYVVTKARDTVGISLAPSYWPRLLAATWQFFAKGRGMMTSNVAEAGGFIRSRAAEPIPDIQWHCLPLMDTRHGQNLAPMIRHYGYSVMVYDLRPKSRGRVRLASGLPTDDPAIEPGYLSDAGGEDIERLLRGVKRTREMLAQSALTPHRGEEVAPGAKVQTDDELRAWIRASAETAYHPVGTCRMGPATEPMAVVDARLRVHGLTGLRVVDASIMPTLVGSNTNAPTTMIGEKAAAMILEDAARSAPPPSAHH